MPNWIKAPKQIKSGLYVKSAPGLLRRDEAVRRLVRKMQEVMPWLTPSDEPAMRAWAEIECLASRCYVILKEGQIVNGKGEPHRLLKDFRQLLQAQLQYANALGMTPAARSSIGANNTSNALDVAQLAAQIEDQNNAEDAPSEASFEALPNSTESES